MTGFIGLAKIELPSATIRLSDGGFIVWGAETFAARDAVFGAIGSIDALEEGIGNQIPALEVTLLPPSTSAAADLSQPGFQKCRARFWWAEYDAATGLLVGTPTLLFDGFLDQSTLIAAKDKFELAVSVVSWLEQLFELNTGNSLNASWHKSIWPGETGHDQGTGLSIQDAWGTDSPPQNTASGFVGASYVQRNFWGAPIV